MANNPEKNQNAMSNEKIKEIFSKMKDSREQGKQALEELNKKLDNIQPLAKKIKDSLIKRHKKEILGAVLTMRPSAPKPGEKPTMNPSLIIISELRKQTGKEKIRHIGKKIGRASCRERV